MMADIDEEDRYGLFGLCIGLQIKDLPLITENLLKVSRMLQHIGRRQVWYIVASSVPQLVTHPRRVVTATIPGRYHAAG